MTRINDVGGMHGFGPLELAGHHEPFESTWEGQLFMLLFALAEKGVITMDMYRHSVERLSPAKYLGLPYYERVLEGLEQLLAEKGWQ